MENKILKSKLLYLVNDFKNNCAWSNSEEGIQSQYTQKLLEYLGWNFGNILINKTQEIKTGGKPDIIIKDDNDNKLLVIESKEASKKINSSVIIGINHL